VHFVHGLYGGPVQRNQDVPGLQGCARGTALGSAQVWTLRERLVKIAVWVERSVRRIVLHLPQAFLGRDTWRALAQALTVP